MSDVEEILDEIFSDDVIIRKHRGAFLAFDGAMGIIPKSRWIKDWFNSRETRCATPIEEYNTFDSHGNLFNVKLISSVMHLVSAFKKRECYVGVRGVLCFENSDVCILIAPREVTMLSPEPDVFDKFTGAQTKCELGTTMIDKPVRKTKKKKVK